MSVSQVRARFVTEHAEYRISDAPFAIPAKLGRSGLSEVINHLLGYEGEARKPFDFCINDVLVRVPLSRFLTVNNISTESVVQIEYMPASMLSDEKQSVDTPAWVGCLDTRTSGLVLVGCYDGSIEMLNAQSKYSEHKMQAHNDPVRAMVSWASSNNRGTHSLFATASKDQSVKCWLVNGAIGNGSNSDVAADKKNSRKKAAAEIASASSLSVHQFAAFNGHSNSVESIEYWGARGFLLSGDWAGNIMGWNVNAALLASGSENAGGGGMDVEEDEEEEEGQGKGKRQKKQSGAAANAKRTSAAGAYTTVTPSAVFTLKAHTQSVTGIQVAEAEGSSPRVFTSSWDHAIKEWDMERQDVLNVYNAGSKIITSMHYNSRTNLVGTSHSDGKIRLWDSRQQSSTTNEGNSASACQSIVNGGSSSTALSAPQWVSQMRWHPSKAMVFASTDYAGTLRVWDMRSVKVPLGKSDTHDGKALCVDWAVASGGGAKDNATVYSGGSDCVVQATEFE